MKNIPDKIYLQAYNFINGEKVEDAKTAMWYERRINDEDIKYVRPNKWISVEDRLPEEEKKHVLVYVKEIKCIFINFIENGEWASKNPYGVISHWQKLPDPPKESR